MWALTFKPARVNEPVSIKKIRQLRNTIQNELRAGEKNVWSDNLIIKEENLYAKT